jgi:hypothetical protein
VVGGDREHLRKSVQAYLGRAEQLKAHVRASATAQQWQGAATSEASMAAQLPAALAAAAAPALVLGARAEEACSAGDPAGAQSLYTEAIGQLLQLLRGDAGAASGGADIAPLRSLIEQYLQRAEDLKRVEIQKSAPGGAHGSGGGGGGDSAASGAHPASSAAVLAEREAATAAAARDAAAAAEAASAEAAGARAAADAAEAGRLMLQTALSEMNEPPIDFICPISMEVMREPVMLVDGHSYERSCIEQVICRSHSCCSHTRIPRVLLTPNPTCPRVYAFLTRARVSAANYQWLATGHDSSPKTNEHLSDTSFRPNHALRGAIAEWHEKCERTAPTS